jgi:glutathione synthase/RimK-type ligase-like ATP-grasp enzyme
MILLWGSSGDGPLTTVANRLARTPSRWAFVDQRASLKTDLELRVGSNVAGRVHGPAGDVDLGEITAAYIRPDDSSKFAAVRRARRRGEDWSRGPAIDQGLLAWADVAPALVVNRPEAMGTTTSKPAQLPLLLAHGFAVPETLVTTDPEEARDFWDQHGEVIAKSISGVRSIVRRLGAGDRARLADVTTCPTQFQRHVPGVDHRVHVIGTAAFCTRVDSAADDYRYAAAQGADLRLTAVAMPTELEAPCRALTAALGLTMAGIDLRRGADGRWFCFEVNPSPAFTFFDVAHDDAMARAVTELLVAHQ